MKTSFRLAALLAFIAAPASFATTLVALDFNMLTRASDAIVVGKVTKVEPRLSKDGSRITTHFTVEVSDALKGDKVQLVEIVQQGGIVGDMGQKVAGTVPLKAGEEIVGFLERRGPSRFMFTGMAQGVFRVERSTDGAATFAVQAAEGDVMLLDPVTRAPVSRGTEPMKLDDLKARVRVALAPPGVAEQPGLVRPPPAVEPRKAVK
ncbi:MAG: hypothetical protein JNK82_05115 [Myxococcaceae bacterium]|nr:hypothetical protein [Myxococcaceae bacterium]